MNQTVTVTIGAVLSGDFVSRFTQADRQVSALRSNVRGLSRDLSVLNAVAEKTAKVMSRLTGVLAGSNKQFIRTRDNTHQLLQKNDQLTSSVARIASAYQTAQRQIAAYNQTAAKQPPNPTPGVPRPPSPASPAAPGGITADMVAGLGLTATGMAGLYAIGNSLKASGDLENAQMRVMVQNMRKDGSYDPELAVLKRQEMRLGGMLPATTKDMIQMDESLRGAGFTLKDLTHGVSEATANLAVLMGQAPQAEAEVMGNIFNSVRLSDKPIKAEEAPELANFLQKVRFGIGVTPEALAIAINRANAHGANITGNYKGLEGTKELSYLLAPLLLAQKTSPELVGSNVGRMLTGLMNVNKVNEANWMFGGGAYFMKNGKLKQGTELVDELSKITKMPLEQRIKWLQHVTGEGTDAGFIEALGEFGSERFRQSVRAIEQQADIDKKIKPVLEDFHNQLMATTTSLDNLRAVAFSGLADQLKPLLSWTNKEIGNLIDWSMKHKTLTTYITDAAVALFMLTAAAGTAATAITISRSAWGKAFWDILSGRFFTGAAASAAGAAGAAGAGGAAATTTTAAGAAGAAGTAAGAAATGATWGSRLKAVGGMVGVATVAATELNAINEAMQNADLKAAAYGQSAPEFGRKNTPELMDQLKAARLLLSRDEEESSRWWISRYMSGSYAKDKLDSMMGLTGEKAQGPKQEAEALRERIRVLESQVQKAGGFLPNPEAGKKDAEVMDMLQDILGSYGRGGGKGSGSSPQASTNTFNIYPLPHQNPQEIAREVAKVLDRRNDPNKADSDRFDNHGVGSLFG